MNDLALPSRPRARPTLPGFQDDECRESSPSMQDPRTQFPQPLFKRQSQEAPGLAAAMDPEPDHGDPQAT